jgi:CubicO group peptidase (beta-lactamase class C family)
MATHILTRRALLSQALRAAAVSTIGSAASALLGQAGPPRTGGGPFAYINAFARQFRVPANSVAVSKQGHFVFDHAGGMADGQHLTPVQQGSLFRIADLSKPVTSVTIFSLVEAGKLKLTDTVFGANGILGMKYAKPAYSPLVTQVTVDDLLTHTSGGWGAGDSDPMFHNNGWNADELITRTLQTMPLTSPPGSQWVYSNFGYFVLGRVIEQVTGQPYQSYVQTNILAPCGINGMQIGRNSEHDRAANEVIYVGQYSEDPYKINLSRTDASDGWIASSTQLVQFLNHVAGAPGIPALLKPETIRSMTTPAAAYPAGDARYARGWMVSENGNGSWWHSGSLPGSTSLMLRTPDGACSAALCNTRSEPHQEMDSALYQMLWTILPLTRG